MSNYNSNDMHFRTFATSLGAALKKLGKRDTKEFLAHQKKQVEGLVALETKLRRLLIKSKFGNSSYRKFIAFIRDEKRNILFARPFFRERQKVFTKRISNALRKKDIKALQRYHFNYQFIDFLLKSRKWAEKSPILQLIREIEKLRQELIVTNMPLAISRARIFYSRTPPSQLSYMDLVQIASEGLMSAIDKFVLPFSKVFRSVIIGRVVGSSISAYSETLIHFYPCDKRLIYRANKVVGKMGGADVDFKKLAHKVNDGLSPKHSTNAVKIADLMAAASCVSADTSPSVDPDLAESIARFSAPDSCRPDVIVESQDAMRHLNNAMKNLSNFEIKLLKLTGVGI